MAYPPPPLPVNRTNATPQQDNHPDDHNAVNGAVNDIVAHLGSNIDQILGQLVRERPSANINAGSAANFLVMSGAINVTTNGNGAAAITLPRTSTVPVVAIAQCADSAQDIDVRAFGGNPGNFQVICRKVDGTGQHVLATAATLTVSWIAIGFQ